MAGSLRRAALALGVVALSAHPSWAAGWGWSCVPAGTAIYAPTPYRNVPSPPPARLNPMPLTAPMPKVKSLAEPGRQPTSAEPPVLPPRSGGPKVIELRSSSAVEPTASTQVAAGPCRVGFWNITGHDVTLTVNGQARMLPKDRALTMQLERNFVWQITGREPQSERVGEGANAYEVVLRP